MLKEHNKSELMKYGIFGHTLAYYDKDGIYNWIASFTWRFNTENNFVFPRYCQHQQKQNNCVREIKREKTISLKMWKGQTDLYDNFVCQLMHMCVYVCVCVSLHICLLYANVCTCKKVDFRLLLVPFPISFQNICICKTHPFFVMSVCGESERVGESCWV